MSWYGKIVLAQGVEQYLTSLGADNDVVQYILSQGANIQLLVNEFRKNPGMSKADLETFQFPQKEEIAIYLDREIYKAKTLPDMEKWLLISYKKLRKGIIPPNKDINLLNNILDPADSINYWKFDSKIDEIADWYRTTLPNIMSFTPKQAIAASDEWHRVIAGEGRGKIYEPTNEDKIIYGPEWRLNPEWSGWTIQEVTSKNDLLVEGFLMNHCIKNVFYDVKNEISKVYSLRDPKNHPHVTIETNESGISVKQIQGNSNTDPSEEYKEMIVFWIENDRNSPYRWALNEDDTGNFDIDGNLDDIADALYSLIQGWYINEDNNDSHLAAEYGLESPIDPAFEEWDNNFDVNELMRRIFETMQWSFSENEDPDKIDWYNENISKALISAIDNFDAEVSDGHNSSKYFSHILKDILKGKINDIRQLESIRPLTEYDKYIHHEDLIQASFAKHILERMGELKDQMFFDFSYGKSWYGKIVLAQGIEQYLTSLGADKEIIQYILSQGNNMQYYVNEFKKNPGMSKTDLEAFQFPQKEEIIDPYLERERQRARVLNDEGVFQQWILFTYKNIRKGKFPPENNISKLDKVLDAEEQRDYLRFDENLDGIADWYRAIHPDITQYSWESAMVATQEWHRMIAGKGEGIEYELTRPERIMYGPKWNNPKWEGWTIQKVDSENDLTAEGGTKKMNHCIDSYWGDVENETSVVYSLRDPQNHPHVTIEMQGKQSYHPGSIQQVKGKSNSEPKDEYKAMIKEWISTSGKEAGIDREINTFEELENNYQYEGINVKDIMQEIDKIFSGETNEYGLRYIFDTTMNPLIEMLTTSGETETEYKRNHDTQYYGAITEAPSYVTNLALMEDLELLHWPRDAGEWVEFRKSPKKSDWENIREVEKWAWDTIDRIMEDFEHNETGLEEPQKENYKNLGDYEIVMKQYYLQEQELYDEWLRSSVKGGFAKDLLDEIEEFRKAKWIPSAQELHDIKKRKQEKELKNNPRYQDAYNTMTQRLDDAKRNEANNNWYKKAVAK